MENENGNLSKYRVLYIKGKYQYKKKYAQITLKHDIKYAGPTNALYNIWSNIQGILRKSNRMDTQSRKELKELEAKSISIDYFEKMGITHLIVYKCLDK